MGRHAVIRQALPGEQSAITALVHSERLNPHDLPWQRFTVALVGGQLVGAVQMREHRDGARELGSLVVAPAWRGQRIAARMIDHLLDGHAERRVHMITGLPFVLRYARWGFRAIPARRAPWSVQRNRWLGALAGVVSMLRGRRPRPLAILERPALPRR